MRFLKNLHYVHITKYQQNPNQTVPAEVLRLKGTPCDTYIECLVPQNLCSCIRLETDER